MTKPEIIGAFAKKVSGIDLDIQPSRPYGHEKGCFCETCRKYDSYMTISSLIWVWEDFRRDNEQGASPDEIGTPQVDS